LIACKTVTKRVTRTVRGKRHKVRVKRLKCTGRLVSGTVKFTASVASGRAKLSRGGHLYATGTRLAAEPGDPVLLLSALRALPRGRYTLTVRDRRGQTLREPITLG
jgi:hypothetical protein